jgi:hypothetical protein
VEEEHENEDGEDEDENAELEGEDASGGAEHEEGMEHVTSDEEGNLHDLAWGNQ